MLIGDMTVTANIATNTSGPGYPVKRKKKKKKDYKVESIYGATVDGAGIEGSGQTRAVGDAVTLPSVHNPYGKGYNNEIMNLKKPVKYSNLTGHMVPAEEPIEEKIKKRIRKKRISPSQKHYPRPRGRKV